MLRRAAIATAAVLTGALAACAPGSRLFRAPALTEASGRVRFAATVNRCTLISVKIENLADPEDLDPPGYAYVAWVQGGLEAPARNLGALTIDRHKAGALEATTTLRDFNFFVTVETSSDALRPTGPPLLWTHRDAPFALVRREQWARIAAGGASR
jgi:hypothetical protein